MSSPAPSETSMLGLGSLSGKHLVRQVVITTIIIILIAVFLVSQAHSFAGTYSIILTAPLSLVLLSLLLSALTYVPAALSYVALASARHIRMKPTLAVQTASGITNRLLPAGLGGAGLYALYMKRSGFSAAESTAIVTANNLLGALGNLILMIAGIMSAPKSSFSYSLPKSIPSWYVAVAIVVAIVVGIVLGLHSTWRRKAGVFIHQTLHSLRHSLKPNKQTAISLTSNMLLTALNGLILVVAVIAVGGHMYWPLTIAVLSAGALLGAAVPTPGGVGGVEAGILAGLVACGVPAAPALAATLLYRTVTYWIPIVPGLLALPWVRKHYLY